MIDPRTILKIFCVSALCASVLGCQRAQEEASSISIQIPTAEKLMAGVSSQSVVSANLLCFVVDIQGVDIPTKNGNSCEPNKGLMSGSKGPGEVLEVKDVPTGTHAFRIYALKKNNAGDVCPVVTKDSWGGYNLTKVYEVSPVITQSVSPENANISIQINLPDESQSYAAIHSVPTSCTSVASTGTSNARVLRGAQFSVGSLGSHLYSKFNDKEVSKDLSSVSGRKLKNWKAGSL